MKGKGDSLKNSLFSASTTRTLVVGCFLFSASIASAGRIEAGNGSDTGSASEPDSQYSWASPGSCGSSPTGGCLPLNSGPYFGIEIFVYDNPNNKPTPDTANLLGATVSVQSPGSNLTFAKTACSAVGFQTGVTIANSGIFNGTFNGYDFYCGFTTPITIDNTFSGTGSGALTPTFHIITPNSTGNFSAAAFVTGTVPTSGIPEPATLGFCAAGLAGLIALRRRFRAA
jgi:hypothetical protein